MTNKEAIARIREHKIIHKMDEPRAIYISEALDMAIKALENQKTGHWIKRHNIYANKTIDTKVCSECQYEYSYDAETGISSANFCPNCGAKMEGENNG